MASACCTVSSGCCFARSQRPSRPVGNTSYRLQALKAGTSLRATTGQQARVAKYQPDIDLLKSAIRVQAPRKEVFDALRNIQRAKAPVDGWEAILGRGDFWKLVFTASTEEVNRNMKDPAVGRGYYSTFYCAMQFKSTEPPYGDVTTGLYLGHVGRLQFRGEYETLNKKIKSTMNEVLLKAGPYDLGPYQKDLSKVSHLVAPGMLFFYADDELLCAQDKDGGISSWSKIKDTEVIAKGLN